MRNCESRAGTCLIATAIFIAKYLSPQRHRDAEETQRRTKNFRFSPFSLRLCVSAVRSLSIPLKDQATVGAAESETVRQGILDRHGPRMIGNVVEIAGRIGVLVVDGGRSELVADR